MINPFSILRLSIRESRKRPPHSDNCFSANLAGSYNLIVDKYTITRSHTDGFQRNNAKCLDEKGISRFVPHSSI